jgi:hypothetical protein
MDKEKVLAGKLSQITHVNAGVASKALDSYFQQ